MPSWAVVGKLGGGKTLWAVHKIRGYLAAGLPVATNVDIFPEFMFSPLWDQHRVKLYRLPNTITRRDLDLLGEANSTTNEEKNGLLVIDESGVSLNARNYNEEGRKELVAWFLHARKLGWDLMFIVQSISLIDKQIRDAILEYRATCRRLDRVNLPILVWLGIKIRLPRIHLVVVRYGLEAQATVADRDVFRGGDLFKAYNTKQLLKDAERQAGVYSVLTPWHLKGRYMSPFQLIRRTAITAALLGMLMGGAATWYARDALQQQTHIPPPQVLEATGLIATHGQQFPDLLLPDGSLVKVKERRLNAAEVYEYSDGSNWYRVEK